MSVVPTHLPNIKGKMGRMGAGVSFLQRPSIGNWLARPIGCWSNANWENGAEVSIYILLLHLLLIKTTTAAPQLATTCALHGDMA